MKSFWRFLLRKSLPADSLSALQYAVFGLGDSGEQSLPMCPGVLKSDEFTFLLVTGRLCEL